MFHQGLNGTQQLSCKTAGNQQVITLRLRLEDKGQYGKKQNKGRSEMKAKKQTNEKRELLVDNNKGQARTSIVTLGRHWWRDALQDRPKGIVLGDIIISQALIQCDLGRQCPGRLKSKTDV
jgi:hypothetical protein